jgi:flagellar biosynthesis protein FlhF
MSVMTADVRTFTADSMQEALDVVRQEMGADAVILHTRHIEKRRFFPWLKSRQEVEITAGLGAKTNGATLRTAEDSEKSSHVATRRLISADDLAPPPQLLKTGAAANSQATTPAPSVSSRTGARAPIPARPDSVEPRKTPKPLAPTVQLSTPTIPTIKTPGEDSTAEIHKRLDALQQALAELTRQAKTRIGDEVPVELFSHYTKLLRADVDESLARDLVMRLKREATAEQLANPQASAGLLLGLVESEIRCAPPIRAARGRRKVVTVVGPTGVGKTTTLAKLAANFD